MPVIIITAPADEIFTAESRILEFWCDTKQHIINIKQSFITPQYVVFNII